MTQRKLIDEEAPPDAGTAKRGGPPNRMNDLDYSTWMKFQKSFFPFSGDAKFVQDCINFFSKEVWPDGRTARILIVGFDRADFGDELGRRHIVHISHHTSNLEQVALEVEQSGLALPDSGEPERFDFALIDARLAAGTGVLVNENYLAAASRISKALRSMLHPGRYCGLVTSTGPNGAGAFPNAWSLALRMRRHLRLRDEKIGLNSSDNSITYCLFFQCDDDVRDDPDMTATSLRVADTGPLRSPKEESGAAGPQFQSWVIPKPPPRNKSEKLHPAKFPETLIDQFIKDFTAPGALVFDPMAGTGSSIVAAIENNRSGIGVELQSTFAEVANRRVQAKVAASTDLFSRQNRPTGLVVQGDSLHLDQIPELTGIAFDYCVTSPPYWSMLSNPGSENQAARRAQGLQLTYSQDETDLGNVQDYDEFVQLLARVYDDVASRLKPKAVLTVIVKNVKRNHILYPLAWNLTAALCGPNGRYAFIGTTLWCQDDVGLKPFAVGTHWVSNILHQYCLHFERHR